MKLLFKLFWAFFKIGIFTFGGGYAMLPMMEKELVEKNHWATKDDLLDFFAVSQCTPGVIAVNTATFIGQIQHGVSGAAMATLGVIVPSFIIITIIAAFINNFADIPVVQHALSGSSLVVCALILASVVKLFKSGVKDIIGIIIFVISFLLMAIFGFSPVFVVIPAAVVGIGIKTVSRKTQKGAEK